MVVSPLHGTTFCGAQVRDLMQSDINMINNSLIVTALIMSLAGEMLFEAARAAGSGRGSPFGQTGTEGTVTKGAVNVAQICATFAKTISQVCAKLRKFRANPASFAQIRPSLHVSAFV